jgi:hypothetical protein
MRKILTILSFICIAATMAKAQGSLRGGSVVLNNGTNTITLAPPSSGLTSYTWSLDTNKNSPDSTRWLMNDGAGNLSWSASPGGLSGNAVQYVPGQSQNTATSGHYLFYLDNIVASSNTGSPGGFIADAVVDGVGSSATGLTVIVSNTLASATSDTLTGLCMSTITSAPVGHDQEIATDVSVNTTGTGINYCALFNGGNVGFGTATPTEQLEVAGNIRILGQNGLKITGGANATSGVATLVAGTIVVNTSKVTANSRIFLMDQNGGGNNPGTPYISARTAGTSFTITSTSATDVSDVAWIIIEP